MYGFNLIYLLVSTPPENLIRGWISLLVGYLWIYILVFVGALSEDSILLGLVFGVVVGLIKGTSMKADQIKNDFKKHFPVENYFSPRETLDLGLILVISSLWIATTLGLITQNFEVLRLIWLRNIILAVLAWFLMFGQFVLRNYSLRFALGLSGYLPWNLTKFFDFAVDMVLMRKAGRTYYFLHRILLNHIAENVES